MENDNDLSQRRVSDLMIYKRDAPLDKIQTFDQLEHSDHLRLENKIKTLELNLGDSQKGILKNLSPRI
jgi:hypothetical protein